MIKVSLITAVYNHEKFLDKCIKSMLAQTYKNIEIIFINNACRDNSQKIIDYYKEKYNNMIISYKTDEALGAGGSRDKGFEFATGDYVCFVDGDDYISETYIEELVKVAEKEYPDIVISGFTKPKLDGEIIYKRQYKDKQEALIQSIAPFGKMFKLKYIKENNLVMRNIPFAEDVIYTAQIILTNPKIALCDSTGYFWVYNLGSTSNVAFRGFPENSLQKAFLWLDDLAKKYPNERTYLSYFSSKYCIWYLLHSGRNISKEKMIEQYKIAFDYLNNNFPEYKRNRYISLFGLKGERRIVKVVIWISVLMEKMKILKWFLSIYCKLPIDKLWPRL